MNIRATMLEPVVVAKFWANRKGDAVVVQIKQFEGRVLIDLRKHCTGADGKMLPTRKGLALTIRRLPELAAAIAKALRTARELHLIAAASTTPNKETGD